MAQHRLLIMRHAKSGWNTDAGKDFDRILNEDGKNDAARMGEWLNNRRYVPERFISSPASRAQQTSHILAGAMGLHRQAIMEVVNIYEASLDDLRAVVDQYGSGVNSLLVVGHNPGLEELAHYLCVDKLPPTENGQFLSAASVIVLNYGDSTISSEASTAKLEVVMRPNELG